MFNDVCVCVCLNHYADCSKPTVSYIVIWHSWMGAAEVESNNKEYGTTIKWRRTANGLFQSNGQSNPVEMIEMSAIANQFQILLWFKLSIDVVPRVHSNPKTIPPVLLMNSTEKSTKFQLLSFNSNWHVSEM